MMASSSVSQDDHDVEHDLLIASRRAKVRSARANRTVNTMSSRGMGEENDRDFDNDGHPHSQFPKYDQTSLVLIESNDASPKPVVRGINKEKRTVPRGAHAGKSNKGVRDRRKLREKRRSTAIGVMHMPSTESTGGSTGEDENEENSVPSTVSKPAQIATETDDKGKEVSKNKSESDLDADDEAAQDSSDVRTNRDDDSAHLKAENLRLAELVDTKDRRITALELQVSQLTRQIEEMKEENTKLVRVLNINA